MILGMINNAQIVDMVAYRCHAPWRSFTAVILCALLSVCCARVDAAGTIIIDSYGDACYLEGAYTRPTDSNVATQKSLYYY